MKENKFSFNTIVDKIVGCFENMTTGSSIEELKMKQSLILLRSAKEDILCGFLKDMEEVGYAGNIYILGRKSDEKYILEFKKLKISVFAINDEERYTTENTGNYIKMINADAICFLYRNVISKGHENLLQIVNQANCEGYAISSKLEVVKFIKLNEYFKGKQIYDDLCEWFYEI